MQLLIELRGCPEAPAGGAGLARRRRCHQLQTSIRDGSNGLGDIGDIEGMAWLAPPGHTQAEGILEQRCYRLADFYLPRGMPRR
jgi:hypothetical protein